MQSSEVGEGPWQLRVQTKMYMYKQLEPRARFRTPPDAEASTRDNDESR